MKNTLSPLQRIKIVLNHYYKRGYNSERCNRIYLKIIWKKFNIKPSF